MSGVADGHSAILAQPVPMDGDTFVIDIEPERYRLLKLSVE